MSDGRLCHECDSESVFLVICLDRVGDKRLRGGSGRPMVALTRSSVTFGHLLDTFRRFAALTSGDDRGRPSLDTSWAHCRARDAIGGSRSSAATREGGGFGTDYCCCRRGFGHAIPRARGQGPWREGTGRV